MATLFTTTNIIVSGILRGQNLPGFGVLDFAPVGIPVVVVGIVYMALVGRRLLPGKPLRTWMERLLAGWSSQGEPFLANVHLEDNAISPLLGLTVYQIRRLAETGGARFHQGVRDDRGGTLAILEACAVAGAKAEGRGRRC